MRHRFLWTALAACVIAAAPCLARPTSRRPAPPEPPCPERAVRCPEEAHPRRDPCGRRSDPCLALRRARTGEDGEWIFRHYSFPKFLVLNRTAAPRSLPRCRMSRELLRKIDRIENAAGAALEGYLLGVRRIRGAGGGCGESRRGSLELLVGESPRAGRKEAIRAWVTPGIREIHPAWTIGRLRTWKVRGEQNAPRIRIRGYLLYNNLKAGEVAAGTRSTAWEISPVTDILFCPVGWKCGKRDEDGWLELDTL